MPKTARSKIPNKQSTLLKGTSEKEQTELKVSKRKEINKTGAETSVK